MKRWAVLVLGIVLGATLWRAPLALARDAEDGASSFVDENSDGIDDRATFQLGDRQMGSMLLSVVSAQLTNAQRVELQEKINTLIADGATHSEIQEAVFADLERFGIDVVAAYLERFRPALTKDQVAGLKAKLNTLRAGGATPVEIQTALRAELAALGLFQGNNGLDQLSGLLTKEQLADLQEKVDTLVKQGVARFEIHRAIQAELKARGIHVTQKPMDDHGGMRGWEPGGMGKHGHFASRPPAEKKSNSGENSK